MKARAALLLGAALCTGVLAAEPAPPPGRAKAIRCAPCHGPQGLSVAPDAPHLAGQPPIYVARQLRAYRSGARSHEVMNVIARPLTDEDIADLAQWYGSLAVEVREPPR